MPCLGNATAGSERKFGIENLADGTNARLMKIRYEIQALVYGISRSGPTGSLFGGQLAFGGDARISVSKICSVDLILVPGQ